MILEEGEHRVIDNFLLGAKHDLWLKHIKDGKIPMFYAPHVLRRDTSNDHYWIHPIYCDLSSQGDTFALFDEVFLNSIKGSLKIDSLVDVRVLWYPKTPEIEEYNIFSMSKGCVDNAIHYTSDSDAYVKLPSGEKIPSMKNRLILYRGKAKDLVFSTHTTNDMNLNLFTHIQCFLNEMPVSAQEPIKF